MKTTEEILYTLGQFKAYAADRYGIEQLGVFGSVARGEQTENSDIDVFLYWQSTLVDYARQYAMRIGKTTWV